MELISLAANPRGYRGFFRDEEKYVYFHYGRKRGYKKLANYHLEDFLSHEHFVGMMSKFVPCNSFLKKPERLGKMTLSELDRIYEKNFG